MRLLLAELYPVPASQSKTKIVFRTILNFVLLTLYCLVSPSAPLPPLIFLSRSQPGTVSARMALHLGIIHFGVFVNHFLCSHSMERIGGLSPRQRHERRVFLRLLRRIRLEAKLTQTDLAKLLGVTQARVSKYEQGERRMDILELKRVCDAVGFPLIEFARQFEEGCGQYSG
jgi:DNA-binding XRE family transcriptional regulator